MTANTLHTPSVFECAEKILETFGEDTNPATGIAPDLDARIRAVGPHNYVIRHMSSRFVNMSDERRAQLAQGVVQSIAIIFDIAAQEVARQKPQIFIDASGKTCRHKFASLSVVDPTGVARMAICAGSDNASQRITPLPIADMKKAIKRIRIDLLGDQKLHEMWEPVEPELLEQMAEEDPSRISRENRMRKRIFNMEDPRDQQVLTMLRGLCRMNGMPLTAIDGAHPAEKVCVMETKDLEALRQIEIKSATLGR